MPPHFLKISHQLWIVLLGLGMGVAALSARGSDPIVIAHRGFSGISAENTLPAFKLAVEAGADLVELDYHHTSDGVPIVIHDFTLRRTTNIAKLWNRPNGRVADYPLARLRELDAGSWREGRFTGVGLPTLEESIRLIQKGSITLIERKGGDAGTLIDLLDKLGCKDAVVVQSFDWNFIKDCRALDSEMVLGALGPPKIWKGKTLSRGEKILNREFVDFLHSLEVQAVVWNRDVTRDAIDHAHSLGLKVWVYTINTAEESRKLVSLGVDGIITDQPALIKSSFRQHPSK